jgi:glycoside/pentoside/hexuronide:cation symporter, GPH family
MNNQKFGKLSFGEKFGYSLGDTAANLAWRPLIAFLPIFYTDTFGLSGAAVALLLVLTRSFDGITDVIMGTIADRTETKWGKFRPYLLWTAIPFGLFLALTFTAPNFTPAGKLAWAYTTYVLLTLVYTANNVPYSSLSGVMTGNVLERTNISSFRFFGAYIGGLISMGLLPKIVQFFGGGDINAQGYQYTFYFLAVLLVVFSVIAFATTKERIRPPKAQKQNLGADFRDLVKNRPWVVMLIVGFLFVTYNSLRQGAAPFYFKWYLGRETLVGLFFIVVLLASIASTFIATPLTRFFGKRRLFIISMASSGIFTCFIYFLRPDQIPLVFTFGVLSELGAGIMPILFFAMLGDAADFSEYKNNRRATGLTFSAGTFAMKFGGGMAGAAMMLVLRYQGYAGQGISEQSEKALTGIRLINSFVPVIFVILAILAVMFYPLTQSKMQEVEAELRSRKEKEEKE